MARRLTAPPSPPWVGDLPVFERTLANGLKALVLPRPGAPVVVCDLYYPVGSVDEPPGRSGVAHFVEHMLFKGTERFPKGQIDRLAFAAAGQANAETAEDFTHYWFAFPADRWPLALAVEADRMRGATFDEDEVEAERRVIVEERARELDSPLGRLDQMHLTVSYLVHPYRNPILGWPEDLRRLDAADLRAFYGLHYRPEGAVLVVVGAVEPGKVLDRISAEFEGLPRGLVPRPGPPLAEPRQIGRRDFSLLESDGVARGLLGWRTVPIGHPDTPALDVLSDLLTCGRRSRLWEHLVERRRAATWAEAAQEGARLSGQFLIQVEAAPGVEAAEVEGEIRAVVDRLAAEGPTAAELARSRRRLEAAWRWEQEDLGGLAAGLGQVALWDDWRAWQEQHRAALAVTADDIRRVASTYLVDSGLTAGWSLPRPARGAIFAPRGDDEAARPRPAAGRNGPVAWPVGAENLGPGGPLIVPGRTPSVAPYRPTRNVLPNGLRVLTERRPGTGTVALEAYVDAGVFREPKPGLAYLTGRMREEGTTTRTADAVAEAIEDVGGTLEVGATGASVRVNAEDLPLAVELLADVLIRPAFPEESFLWARRRIGAELRADRDDPAFRADLLFRSVVYGDHPYGRDVRGGSRQLASLTLDDVRGHHERFFGPENAFLVAVGDFEPKELRGLLRRHFAPWRGAGGPLPTPPRPERASRPRVRRVSHEGAQVHILLGHLGVARDDPDYDALVVLDHILGSGPGFADRLSRTLRDELGLAYTVGGGMTDSADLAPGLFRIYIGTGPDEADRAVAAALEQVRAVHRGAFDDEEVDRARRYLAGAWVFDYQTVGQRAERLLELERWSLPLDEPLRWPERIARVTPRQVRQAARRHIDPAALVRVEYGPTARPRRRARMDCA